MDADPGEMVNLYGDKQCTEMRSHLTDLMLHSRIADDRTYSLPTRRDVRLHAEVSSSFEPET